MWRTNKAAIPPHIYNLSVALIHTWSYLSFIFSFPFFFSFFFFHWNLTWGGGWIWCSFTISYFSFWRDTFREQEREWERCILNVRSYLRKRRCFAADWKKQKNRCVPLCYSVYVCVCFSWTVLFFVFLLFFRRFCSFLTQFTDSLIILKKKFHCFFGLLFLFPYLFLCVCVVAVVYLRLKFSFQPSVSLNDTTYKLIGSWTQNQDARVNKKKIILHHSCIPFCPGFRNQRLFHLRNKTQSLTCTRSLYNRSAISAKDSEKSCLFCFFIHKRKMKIKVPVTAAMFFCFLPCRNSAPNRPVTPVESSVDFLFVCFLSFCPLT